MRVSLEHRPTMVERMQGRIRQRLPEGNRFGLGGEGHSRGTVDREVPSDGGFRGDNGFSIRGTLMGDYNTHHPTKSAGCGTFKVTISSSHRPQVLVQPGQRFFDVLRPWRDVIGLVEDESLVLRRGCQQV